MLFTGSKQRTTLRLGEYLYTEKMSLLSISALADYFDKETKSLKRGENHYESGHVESFSFSSGIITGSVKASMKDRTYKVTVSPTDSCLFFVLFLFQP